MSEIDAVYAAAAKKQKKRSRRALFGTAAIAGATGLLGYKALETRINTNERLRRLGLSIIPVSEQATRWSAEAYNYWEERYQRNKAANLHDDQWEEAHRLHIENRIRSQQGFDEKYYNPVNFRAEVDRIWKLEIEEEKKKAEIYSSFKNLPNEISREEAVKRTLAPIEAHHTRMENRVKTGGTLASRWMEKRGYVPSTDLEKVDVGDIEFTGNTVHLELPKGYADYNDRLAYIEGIQRRQTALADISKIDDAIMTIYDDVADFSQLRKGASTSIEGDPSLSNTINLALGLPTDRGVVTKAEQHYLNGLDIFGNGIIDLGGGIYKTFNDFLNDYIPNDMKKNDTGKYAPYANSHANFKNAFTTSLINYGKALKEYDELNNWSEDSQLEANKKVKNEIYIADALKYMIETRYANVQTITGEDVRRGMDMENARTLEEKNDIFIEWAKNNTQTLGGAGGSNVQNVTSGGTRVIFDADPVDFDPDKLDRNYNLGDADRSYTVGALLNKFNTNVFKNEKLSYEDGIDRLLVLLDPDIRHLIGSKDEADKAELESYRNDLSTVDPMTFLDPDDEEYYPALANNLHNSYRKWAEEKGKDITDDTTNIFQQDLDEPYEAGRTVYTEADQSIFSNLIYGKDRRKLRQPEINTLGRDTKVALIARIQNTFNEKLVNKYDATLEVGSDNEYDTSFGRWASYRNQSIEQQEEVARRVSETPLAVAEEYWESTNGIDSLTDGQSSIKIAQWLMQNSHKIKDFENANYDPVLFAFKEMNKEFSPKTKSILERDISY